MAARKVENWADQKAESKVARTVGAMAGLKVEQRVVPWASEYNHSVLPHRSRGWAFPWAAA